VSTIVQCRNENGEPRCIEVDPKSDYFGWVFYRHPDGQWVTLRKATTAEIESATRRELAAAAVAKFGELFKPVPAAGEKHDSKP